MNLICLTPVFHWSPSQLMYFWCQLETWFLSSGKDLSQTKLITKLSTTCSLPENSSGLSLSIGVIASLDTSSGSKVDRSFQQIVWYLISQDNLVRNATLRADHLTRLPILSRRRVTQRPQTRLDPKIRIMSSTCLIWSQVFLNSSITTMDTYKDPLNWMRTRPLSTSIKIM